MVAVTNQLKQDLKPQQGQGQDLSNATSRRTEAIKSERPEPKVDTDRLRAILNVKETTEVKQKQIQTTQSPDGKINRRETVAPKHNHRQERTVGGETVEHEMSDRIAFRYVGSTTKQVQNASQKVKNSTDPYANVISNPEESLLLGATGETRGVKNAGAAPLTGTQNSQESEAASTRFGTGQDKGAESAPSTGQQQKETLSAAPKQEVVKLLDLVGPDATMTFRERLREVWVVLDDSATTSLDVMARMPATLTGMSNSDLLMVQSPQGVHFVAFLKNRNDFEVLATFDRQALLPGDPNKQLLEAAVIAYEQLGAVFKEGASMLEGKVRDMAASDGMDQLMFQMMQGRYIISKRRKKKCDDLVEQLVDQITELEKIEQRKEAESRAQNESTKSGQNSEIEEERVIAPEHEKPVLDVGDDE